MAAAHVQLLGSISKASASAETTTVIAPSSKTVTTGNLIVVGISCFYNFSPSGVTDNLGNTYVHIENGSNKADLWYAFVTAGGSITAITITHDAQRWRMAIASEFSGLSAFSEVGGGTTATSTSAKWVNSKTIPIGGLAVGIASCVVADPDWTAGAASGSPSTTIVQSGQLHDDPNDQCIALGYAIAGASAVTSFNGIETADVSCVWVTAGGLFHSSLLKTVNGLAKASVKTLRSGLAIASGKKFNGLT
jgi:hypothetical protein